MADDSTDGWYADPWRRWPERYFANGLPTGRVRSGIAEGSDPIPGYGSPPEYPQSPGGYAYGHPGYGQPPPYGQAGYGYGYPPRPKAGDARTGPLPLHPMSMGDIIDGAFRLFRANFKTIVIVIAVISAPLQLISAIIQRNAQQHLLTFNFNTQQNSTNYNARLDESLLTILISLIILPYAAGAISRVVAASYLGSTISSWEALRIASRRFFPLLTAWFLIHLLEIIGTVVLILPGLIFMALSVCVAPAIVIEGLGPMQGINRSWGLNRPRIWPIMGIAILSGIMVGVLGDIIGLPMELLAYAVGLHWGFLILWIGLVAANTATVSLTAIIATLIYFDGRIRYEGLDLQILAGGLG